MRVKICKGSQKSFGKDGKVLMDCVGLQKVECSRQRSKDFLMNLRPRRRINYCELSPIVERDLASENASLLKELIRTNRELRKYLRWFQCYAAAHKSQGNSCTNFQQFVKKLRNYQLKLLGSGYKPKQFYKQIFLDTNLPDAFTTNVNKYSNFIKERYVDVNNAFLQPSPELAQRIQRNLEQEAATFTLVISNLHKKNKKIESSLITRYKKIHLPDCNNNENLKHFKKKLLDRQDLERFMMKGGKNYGSKGSKLRSIRMFPYKYHRGMELHKLGPKEDVNLKARAIIKRLKSERVLKLYVKIQRSVYEEFIQTGQYSVNQFKFSLDIFKKYYFNHLRTNHAELFVHLKTLNFNDFSHQHFINSLIYYSSNYQNSRQFRENSSADFIKRGLEIAFDVFSIGKLNLVIFSENFYPIYKEQKFNRSSFENSENMKKFFVLKEKSKLCGVGECEKFCKRFETLKNFNCKEKVKLCGKQDFCESFCANDKSFKLRETLIETQNSLTNNENLSIKKAESLNCGKNLSLSKDETEGSNFVKNNGNLNLKKESIIVSLRKDLIGNVSGILNLSKSVSSKEELNEFVSSCKLNESCGGEIKSVEVDKLQNVCFRKLESIKETETDRFVEILESKQNKRIKVADLRIEKFSDVRKVKVLEIKENLGEKIEGEVEIVPEAVKENLLVKQDKNCEICCGNRKENVRQTVDFRNIETLINPKQENTENSCSTSVYPTRPGRNIFDVVFTPPKPQAENVRKVGEVKSSKVKKVDNLVENQFDAKNCCEVNMLQKITENFNKSIDYHFGQDFRPPQPKLNKPEIPSPPKPRNFENQISNVSPCKKFPHQSNIRTEIYQTNQIFNKLYEFYFDTPTLVNLNNEILQLYNYPEHRVVLSWMNHATSIIRPKFGNCFPFISFVSTLQGFVYVKHQSLYQESISSPYVIALAPALTQVILELLNNPHSQLQEHLTLAIAISPETTTNQIACYTQFIFNYLHNYKYRCTVLGRNPSVNPWRQQRPKDRITVLSNIRISPGKRKGEELNGVFGENRLLSWFRNCGEEEREISRLSAKKFMAFLYWDAQNGMMINWSCLDKNNSAGCKVSDLPTYEEHLLLNCRKRRQRVLEENEMFRRNLESQRFHNFGFNHNLHHNFVQLPQIQTANYPNYFRPNYNPTFIPNYTPNFHLPKLNQNLPVTLPTKQTLNVSEVRENSKEEETRKQLTVTDVVEIIGTIEKSLNEWIAVDKQDLRNENSSPSKVVSRRKTKFPKRIVVDSSLPEELTNLAKAVVNILQIVPENVRKKIGNVNSAKIFELLQRSYETIYDQEKFDVAIDKPKLKVCNSNQKIIKKFLPCFRKVKKSCAGNSERKSRLSLDGKLVLTSFVGKGKSSICGRKVSIEDVVARCNKKLLNSSTKEIGQVSCENRNKLLQFSSNYEQRILGEDANFPTETCEDSCSKNLTISDDKVISENGNKITERFEDSSSKICDKTIFVQDEIPRVSLDENPIIVEDQILAKVTNFDTKLEDQSKTMEIINQENVVEDGIGNSQSSVVSCSKNLTISDDKVICKDRNKFTEIFEDSSNTIFDKTIFAQDEIPCVSLDENPIIVDGQILAKVTNFDTKLEDQSKTTEIINQKNVVEDGIGSLENSEDSCRQKLINCNQEKSGERNCLNEITVVNSKNFEDFTSLNEDEENLVEDQSFCGKFLRVSSRQKVEKIGKDEENLVEDQSFCGKFLRVSSRQRVEEIGKDEIIDCCESLSRMSLEEIRPEETSKIEDLKENCDEIFSVADSIEEINEEIIYTEDFPKEIVLGEEETIGEKEEIGVKFEMDSFEENSVSVSCRFEESSMEEFSKFGLEENFEEEKKNKIVKNYNCREEIDDFNLSEIYDSEMAIEFSSIANLTSEKDIDDLVLDLFIDDSDDLIISEATASSGFTLLEETSKSFEMDFSDEDSNDTVQSTTDITENIYDLEDSIVQINLDKHYFIHAQRKFRLNREYLSLLCEKLTKPESVYMNCNKQKRLTFHYIELENFISCGIFSKQISINVALCVYFLIVCIKCGIDLVPDLQNYAKNVLDVEGYKKELALLEKCVVPDIVKDFYEFINFYNFDRAMELISFEYFVDNLWNGNLLDYYLGFFHYAKFGGICK